MRGKTRRFRAPLKGDNERMKEWKDFLEDSKNRWESNSAFWDDYMGNESNDFHRDLIRPDTERLLNIKKGENVLDIACGNGNFSRRLVELGANVVAFDFSSVMIERAQLRSSNYLNNIDYKVMDATDYNSLINFGKGKFNKAVCNMGLMDMAEIVPLLKALNQLLKEQGIFVFSIVHPCFQVPGCRKILEQEEINNQIVYNRYIQISKYIKPETFECVGIRNEPVALRSFHRPLSNLFEICFGSRFVINGIAEPVFDIEKYDSKKFDWFEIPAVLIIRLIKLS
jgi:2-polyprenyl-3-methyl-5-hydroxy-6-metoxy-1,4-benzoquinol methylase